MRPTDLIGKVVVDELLRLYRVDPWWIEVEEEEDGKRLLFHAKVDAPWMHRFMGLPSSVHGIVSLLGLSNWIGEGPKVFRPSTQQSKAMENIDVNLSLDDYSQPFPAVLVELGPDYRPLAGLLCWQSKLGLSLVGCYGSNDNRCTISVVHTYRSPGSIENTLRMPGPSADHDANLFRAMRVAVNSCLALSHYGHHLDYLYPKEVESDQRLAREKTERGERARHRLALAVQVVSFDQEVKLHRTEGRGDHEAGTPTGGSMPPHWRRGHWVMQACGPAWSQRKRILRPPVLVRRDLLTGDVSQSTTTYRG